MYKLIFIPLIALVLFGCGDSNNQAKPADQSSNQQDKNKPESAPQNTTSPGY